MSQVQPLSLYCQEHPGDLNSQQLLARLTAPEFEKAKLLAACDSFLIIDDAGRTIPARSLTPLIAPKLAAWVQVEPGRAELQTIVTTAAGVR